MGSSRDEEFKTTKKIGLKKLYSLQVQVMNRSGKENSKHARGGCAVVRAAVLRASQSATVGSFSFTDTPNHREP